MENSNNQNEINDQNNAQQNNNNEQNIEIDEEIKPGTNQNLENENVQPNSNDEKKNIKEEEKNNEIMSLYEQKMKESEKEKLAQRQAKLQFVEKKYNDLFQDIISHWEKDKSNFEQYYETQISKELCSMVDQPCIVLYQEIIGFIFIFLCKYFNFLKDNMKEIPQNVMKIPIDLTSKNIFMLNPNIQTINNIQPDYYDLIGDKFFYELFKKLLPEGEIENPQLLFECNCMAKYFLNYLFDIGFYRNFIVDFLSRNDLDFNNYYHFSNFIFHSLYYCDDAFIKKNDYNLLAIKNYVQKMNYFLDHCQEFINKNKDDFLNFAKNSSSFFHIKMFGGLTRIFENFEQNNLMDLLDNYCFTLFRHIEILLKQQKLELRIFGFNNLINYIGIFNNPSIYHKNNIFSDREKVFDYTKKQFIKFLQKINIFDLVFGENIHEALIQRSYLLFSFLYKNKVFTTEQISLLWNMSQSKYQSICNSIISLFGKLLPEFSNEDCNTILQTVTNMNLNEVNEITLKLLENFFSAEKRHENLLNILFKYSNELSYFEGLSNNIINKSRDILVNLLFNKKYVNDLYQCIKNCFFCIDNNYLIDTNITLINQIMNKLIETEKSDNTLGIFKFLNENIQNFGSFLYNLDGKYSIFTILLNNILFMKRIFVFFTEEAIKFKKLINEGNFDFDTLLDINQLLLRYNQYEQQLNNNLEINKINEEENKMDIDTYNTNTANINEKENNKNLFLLPKNKNDIQNYLKILMNDFINYFRNTLLKEKICLNDEEIAFNLMTKFEFSINKNTYQKMITLITDFIFNTHNIANMNIKRTIFDILYELLVENSIIKAENEIFYSFLSKIINSKIDIIGSNLIEDDDIEYLCLQKISLNDIKDISFWAYQALNKYIIYINEKNGNIIYMKESKKYLDIKRIDLFIGFKTLLEFYIFTGDIKIFVNASTSLSNIIEVASKDMFNRRFILDHLFSLLQEYYKKIKENEQNNVAKFVFKRVLKLISIVNKTMVTKNFDDRNDIKNFLNINLINNFFISNDNNIISFKVFKGLTIKELKNEIIDKLLCNDLMNLSLFNNISNYPHPYISNLDELKNEIKKNNLIVLSCNSEILNDYFTLDEYNIKNGDTITILNGACTDLSEYNFNMNEEQLKDAYEQIRVVFNDTFNEEIMKGSLYKHKGDIQNAILYLAEEENAEALKKEIEDKKKHQPKKRMEIICLEENKFNILLDILNEGDNELNTSIWDLFAQIKFQDLFIINSIGNGFDGIFEEKNVNKQILILKIINSVVFDDDSFCKNNKITKTMKNQWISKFLNNDEFIIKLLTTLSELKMNENNQFNDIQLLFIIINWFSQIFDHIYELKKVKNKEEDKKTEEKKEEIYGQFEIIENEADKFLEIVEKNNFVLLFYKILGISLDIPQNNKDKKITNIDKMNNIIYHYLSLKPGDIIKFFEEEKKMKKIKSILIVSGDSDIRKNILFFIENTVDIIYDKKSEEKNENTFDIQTFLLNYFYPEIISNEVYQEEFYFLYDFLININDLELNAFPYDKIIDKYLNNIYDIIINKINIINNDYESINKIANNIKYNLYILNCFNTFYSELLENGIDKLLNEKKDIISILYDCPFNIKIDETNNNIKYIFLENDLLSGIFDFLSTVISIDKKYYDILLPKILIQHKKIILKKADLPLKSPLRNFSTQKYIGLKNLGATCYLNSLFQQMYMIPTFYKDLFSFNIIDNVNEKENLMYSTIYNMQISFANLQKSCMNFYSPNDFIKSFKTAFNGEPIRCGVQQDTDEFLAILCDELEKEAKKYGRENFLENSFKGKISNEIVSLEDQYPFYSQTEEPFLRITLDIKGHKNLEDALDAYIKDEILDGDNKYFVEKYNKKISIKKRTSIKKIGNQIIIHLKRFDFDFISFQNNKLNDYLKFPLKINLKRWTRAFIRTNETNNNNGDNNNIISEEEKENLNDDKMNYELTGILVHSGASLQSGHYYSFIKDQRSDKWYQFNDSRISDYDIDKDLEKECFGTIDAKKNQYGKGAYLLIYTKKDCIDSYKKNEKDIQISENILKQVEKENINFINIKTFAFCDYKNFLIKFIKNSSNYLKDCISDINEKENYMFLMNKEILQEIKIYEKLVSLLKGNKENNIDINDEEIKTLPENIEQIYEKCKTEIIYNERDEKAKKINNKNITLKNIIKVLYCYTFGIIYQYNDIDSALNECLSLLCEILNQKPIYCVTILKLMEKNIDIFNDLLFRYGFIDKDMKGINKSINDLYTLLFNSIYNFEKENYGFITNKTFHHFVKDNKGQLKIEKEYQSLFLRVFKKIFLLNLEKCRKEYLRESLFLNLFDSIVKTYPESSIVSSHYLLSLISFITNNALPDFRSTVNPNYKMGNKFDYVPNIKYVTSFCNIILSCATPGMIMSKKISPYFISRINYNKENPNFALFPLLPDDWRKMLVRDFITKCLLFSRCDEPIKVLLHLSFNDKETSITIMKMMNIHLKNQATYTASIYPLNIQFFDIFNLNDNLNVIRAQILFELDNDNNNNTGKTLIDFYHDISKWESPMVTIWGVYVISKIILQNQLVCDYFKKNKTKIEWIKDFYIEILVKYNEKTNVKFNHAMEVYLQSFSDLFTVVENAFINNL